MSAAADEAAMRGRPAAAAAAAASAAAERALASSGEEARAEVGTYESFTLPWTTDPKPGARAAEPREKFDET